MRESLQRRRGPWRFNDSRTQPSTDSTGWMRLASTLAVQVWRTAGLLIVSALVLPATAFAQQSPWERAATNLEQTFTGPLARSLALVAIVIGGLMFMFGEAGAKRQISGIVFGGGLALFAAQFLTWLF